jgi:2-polyprenyl-3-methyl-5-hydroxy-6-metoxy-1,4-benzoquinol methylase
MNEVMRRPFYAEYAWAFDLLIDRPVRRECAAIARWLIDRGVLPGSRILDAGCGTGRYALELARRGYVVHGVDLSPELIAIATHAMGDATGSISFGVGDITHLPASRYAAILCRGVLNDIVDDASRDAVFRAFAEALRTHGVLIFDQATGTRATSQPEPEGPTPRFPGIG